MSNFDESNPQSGATPKEETPAAPNAPRPKPAPAYYFLGRPVYTREQLAQMDCPFSPEPEWQAEWEKFEAEEAAKKC